MCHTPPSLRNFDRSSRVRATCWPFAVRCCCTWKQAVSHFFPGAFQHLPNVQVSKELPQLFMCGDWIARGGHRSWSQVTVDLNTTANAIDAANEYLQFPQVYCLGILDVSLIHVVQLIEPRLACRPCRGTQNTKYLPCCALIFGRWLRISPEMIVSLKFLLLIVVAVA